MRITAIALGVFLLTLAGTAQAGDWIQARLNDHMVTADGQWLANRDILRVGRIYGFGDDRQVEVRRRQPDGTWSRPFTLAAAYAQQHATLGYASTVYAAIPARMKATGT